MPVPKISYNLILPYLKILSFPFKLSLVFGSPPPKNKRIKSDDSS
jgi:hypothetical protein